MKELRLAHKTKRHELAVQLGVDPTTIRRWEEHGPPRDRIPEVALYFGVTPAYLMGWEEAAA